MKPLTIILKSQIQFRLDASFITTNNIKTSSQFKNLKIFYGNKLHKITNLFKVSGDDVKNIIIKSSTNKIDNIGYKMKNMKITVFGHAGNSFGKEMLSGSLKIYGNTLDYTGAGIKGGNILVYGNTGKFLAGKPIGKNEGMLDGLIYIHGNVGDYSIERMRRGIIVINGDIGSYCCSNMVSGSIIIKGKIGNHFCDGIKRGTVITTQKKTTFNYIPTNNSNLNFFNFYMKKLYAIIGKKIFPDRIKLQRFYGRQDSESLSEIFLISK